MKLASKARRYLWVVPIILGAVFIASGAYMFTEGRAAKAQVKDSLVAEQITTSKDASIPGVLVQDAATAQAQADAIHEHSLALENGKTYSQMTKDDPNRATYLDGVGLRTALSLAVMGFKVSDLVMGIGAFLIVTGATNVFFLAPVLFLLRGRETEKGPASQKATRHVAAGAI